MRKEEKLELSENVQKKEIRKIEMYRFSITVLCKANKFLAIFFKTKGTNNVRNKKDQTVDPENTLYKMKNSLCEINNRLHINGKKRQYDLKPQQQKLLKLKHRGGKKDKKINRDPMI